MAVNVQAATWVRAYTFYPVYMTSQWYIWPDEEINAYRELCAQIGDYLGFIPRPGGTECSGSSSDGNHSYYIGMRSIWTNNNPYPPPSPPEPEVTYTISISSIISPPYKNYITSMDPSLTKGLVVKVMGSDGNLGNIPVDMTVTAKEGTGGHVQAHHSARNPTHSGVIEIGSRNGTSLKNITINGEQEFKFTSPKSSGDYSVEITCPNHTCSQTKPDKIWVGIKDLKSLPASPLYNFIGDTDAHPDNHYVSDLAAKKIDNIAFVYNEDYPEDDVLHINDTSLERGGLFDITGEWKPDHKTHNKGTDIDIRANEFVGKTPGDVPKRNYKDFYRISKRHGCLAIREFADQPKEHFHLYCNEKYGKAE